MRGVDEPHGLAVGEKADGDAAVAKQAVELGRGRVVPGPGHALGLVEVEARGSSQTSISYAAPARLAGVASAPAAFGGRRSFRSAIVGRSVCRPSGT